MRSVTVNHAEEKSWLSFRGVFSQLFYHRAKCLLTQMLTLHRKHDVSYANELFVCIDSIAIWAIRVEIPKINLHSVPFYKCQRCDIHNNTREHVHTQYVLHTYQHRKDSWKLPNYDEWQKKYYCLHDIIVMLTFIFTIFHHDTHKTKQEKHNDVFYLFSASVIIHSL